MYGGGYNSKKYGFKTDTKYYIHWRNMLRRCYDPKYHIKQPSYKDCVVCEDWLDFQNFAKWYEENKYDIDEPLSLDKDLVCMGNKTYCPEMCTLVPQSLNSILANTTVKGMYPLGVYYHKRAKKFTSSLATIHGRVHYGYHDTPEQAHKEYVENKEKYVHEVIAEVYKGKIPTSVYTKLKNYKVLN